MKNKSNNILMSICGVIAVFCSFSPAIFAMEGNRAPEGQAPVSEIKPIDYDRNLIAAMGDPVELIIRISGESAFKITCSVANLRDASGYFETLSRGNWKETGSRSILIDLSTACIAKGAAESPCKALSNFVNNGECKVDNLSWEETKALYTFLDFLEIPEYLEVTTAKIVKDFDSSYGAWHRYAYFGIEKSCPAIIKAALPKLMEDYLNASSGQARNVRLNLLKKACEIKGVESVDGLACSLDSLRNLMGHDLRKISEKSVFDSENPTAIKKAFDKELIKLFPNLANLKCQFCIRRDGRYNDRVEYVEIMANIATEKDEVSLVIDSKSIKVITPPEKT